MAEFLMTKFLITILASLFTKKAPIFDPAISITAPLPSIVPDSDIVITSEEPSYL